MSTGKPLKTQADLNRVKNEYDEMLEKRIKLNQENYEANKQYIANGTLPAISQMADTRSTTEKLRDSEFLKRKIIDDLAPIAEPFFATNIISKVQSHPLNIDGKFLRFFAQNASEISAELKKRYNLGIEGDENDAQVLVSYVAEMFSRLKDSSVSINTYSKSNIQNAGRGGVLTANDIEQVVNNLKEIMKRLTISGERTIYQRVKNRIDDIINRIIFVKECLPSQQTLNQMIENINRNPMGDANSDMLSDVFKVLEKLPSNSQVQAVIDILKQYIDRTPQNMNRINESMSSLDQLFQHFFTPENNRLLRKYRAQFQIEAQEQIKQNAILNNKQLTQEIRKQTQAERDASNASKVYIVNPMDDAVFTRDTNNQQHFVPV